MTQPTQPTVVNVTYDKTRPVIENVGAALLEAEVSVLFNNHLSENSAIRVVAGLEAVQFRDHAQQAIRAVTADTTTTYSDGTKSSFVHHGLIETSNTQYSAQGNVTNKVHTIGMDNIVINYKNNAPASTTYYPSEGGSYSFDANGNHTNSICTIN